jgi:hypothetical protein
MRTDLLVIRLPQPKSLLQKESDDQTSYKFKLIYSTFDDETYEDVIMSVVLDLEILMKFPNVLTPCELTFFNY